MAKIRRGENSNEASCKQNCFPSNTTSLSLLISVHRYYLKVRIPVLVIPILIFNNKVHKKLYVPFLVSRCNSEYDCGFRSEINVCTGKGLTVDRT